MRYIDLFGGIGGFRYGISRATNNKWECVFYSDNDRYAVQTYNKNFNTDHRPKDIREIRSGDIPRHDIICAGFPCQTFSIAGKRKGFSETRGTLFFEICRIAEYHRPQHLFLENVKGLLSHDKGRTFAIILSSLDKLGYDAEWQVLNSKHFGVPQNRERVFIIGHLRGKSRPKVFPIGQGSKEIDKTPERDQQYIISHSRRTGDEKKGGTGMLMSDEHSFTIDRTPHLVTKYRHSMKGFKGYNNISCPIKSSQGSGNQIIVIDVYNKRLRGESPSLTDPCHNSIRLIDNQRIRKLTPTECERLQGFPDNWTEGCSDTQRYKQLGNAVTTNVIRAIVERWNEVMIW